MKTILITAYAVNPYKGSEDGTGWNIVREMAKEYKVILVTRKNNIPHLKRFVTEHPDSLHRQISFYGYDLPNAVLRIKKKLGSKAHVAYYYLWQYGVYRFIKQQQFEFELAHALNFHSDSHPHFLWKLNKPTVWGPIGHHPPVKRRFLTPTYGLKSLVVDRLFQLGKWGFRVLDPWRRKAMRKTNHILTINSHVQSIHQLPNSKCTIVPAIAAAVRSVSTSHKEKVGFQVLSAGRFHYMKGFDITIRSFALFYYQLPANKRTNVHLTLVGSGSEQKRLKKLCNRCGIEKVVKWIPWVDYSEMERIYLQTDVFLFPSHEGAGMVIPEAMSYGLPILTFNNIGPGELMAHPELGVTETSYAASVCSFADRLMRIHSDPTIRSTYIQASNHRFSSYLNWEEKGKTIRGIYQKVLSSTHRPQPTTIAVIHPSSELYGADRILVVALQSLPTNIRKRVYLPSNGPLVSLLQQEVKQVEVCIHPNIPIIYRSLFTPKGLLQFFQNRRRFISFFKKEKDQYAIKTVYLNTLACSFLLRPLHRMKLRTYIHVHEIIEKPWFIAKLSALLCQRYASSVVCVSNAVRQNLLKYAPKISHRSMVIYNGIVAKTVNTSTTKIKSPRIFLLVGRIMPKKGQWYLIEALGLLPKELLKNRKFIFVGDVLKGNEHLKEELLEAIRKAGLEDHIELTGFLTNVDSLLARADVCLVPSLMKDPFPTTVLEAMSAGKPVIATNHGGAAEAIRDGISGCLISPTDAQEFAATIRKLIEKPALCEAIGKAAKEDFHRRFSIDTFRVNWNEFQFQYRYI